jgi:S1-C subfamily serine protease
LIVTADEALAEEGEISLVSPSGETAAATLVGRDPTTDIALLRADDVNAPAVPLQSMSLRAGALALAVGARSNAPIAAFGAVSFVGPAWRSLRGGEIDGRVELDLSLRRAGEGGLALDVSGRAFGMVVFGPRRTVLVIPAATIERVAGKLQTHGRIARGYLGLGLQAANLDGDGGIGAMVMSVDPTGPGSAAGVRQGDLIVNWNGGRIRDVRTLLRALGPESVGQTVKLSLSRGGEAIEVTLTIGERPES